MYTYLIMLTFCAVAQRILGKALYNYNINPNSELVDNEYISYTDYWSSPDFDYSPQVRSKHYAAGRPYKMGYGSKDYGNIPYAFDGYDYSDLTEEYNDEMYYPYHHNHPHGVPPGQRKKQEHPRGRSHRSRHGPPHDPPHRPPHGPPHHPPHCPPHPPPYDSPHDAPRGPPHGPKHAPPHGPPYEIPPRFPPPPVYNKNFMNPWTLSETTSKPLVVQQPPTTTPSPHTVLQSSTTTTVESKLTTPTPPSSTTADGELLYDIDVRFGRD